MTESQFFQRAHKLELCDLTNLGWMPRGDIVASPTLRDKVTGTVEGTDGTQALCLPAPQKDNICGYVVKHRRAQVPGDLRSPPQSP